jgi:hypothetical protein
VAGANSKIESFTGLHSVDSALREDAAVEKGVTGTIGEFDKAKPLLRTEPFHDAADRWT